MPSVTVYPVANPSGSWEKLQPTSVGESTLWEALDASEGSHIDVADPVNTSNNLFEIFEFDTSGIPAGAIVTSVQISFRYERRTHGGIKLRACAISPSGSSYYAGPDEQVHYGTWNVKFTIDEAAVFTLANGDAWSEHSRIGCILEYLWGNQADNTFKLYWVTATIEYDGSAPVSVATSPTGELDAAVESIGWTYTQDDGRPQTHYEAKIFSDATYQAHLFDADTAAHEWSSGKTGSSSARSVAVSASLVEGTYWAAVKVHSSTSSGSPTESGWSFVEFSIDYPEAETETGTGGGGEPVSLPDPTEVDLYPVAPPALVLPVFEPDGGYVDVNVVGEADWAAEEAGALDVLTEGGAVWYDVGDIVGTGWRPRHTGPIAQDGEPVAVRLNGSPTSRWILNNPPELALDVGSVVEVDCHFGNAGVISPRVAKLNSGAGANFLLRTDSDTGQFIVYAQDGTNSRTFNSTAGLPLSDGDRVIIRFEWLTAREVGFSYSIDGGETYLDAGSESHSSDFLVPIPMDNFYLGDGAGGLLDGDVFRLTVDGLDLFDGQRHGIPGQAVAGSDVPGAWWSPLGPDGEVVGTDIGTAVLVDECNVLPHSGINYAWYPGSASTVQDWRSAATDMTGQTTTDVIVISDLDDGPDTYSSIYNHPKGVVAGAGRLLMYMNANIIITYLQNADGTTTDASFALSGAGEKLRGPEQSVTGVRVVVLWDNGTGAADLELLTTDTPLAELLADPQGADWVSRSTGTTISTNISFPPSSTVMVGSNGLASYRCQGKIYRALTLDENGSAVSDWYPDRDVSASTDPDAGQSSMVSASTGVTWTPTRITGADEHKMTLVTRPVVEMASGGYVQLGESMKPTFTEEDGSETIVPIFRTWDIGAVTNDRIYSSSPDTASGANIFWTNASETVTYRVGGADAQTSFSRTSLGAGSLLVAALIIDGDEAFGWRNGQPLGVAASRVGDGIPSFDPPRLGVRSDAFSSRGDMELFGFFHHKTKAMSEEEMEAAAGYFENPPAPLPNRIVIERSQGAGAFEEIAVLEPQALPFFPAVRTFRDLTAAFHDTIVYRARVLSAAGQPTLYKVSEAVETPSDRWWMIDPSDESLIFSPHVMEWNFSDVLRSTVSRQRNRVAVAASPVLGSVHSLTIRTLSLEERQSLEAILDTGRPFRLVDIYGREWFVKQTEGSQYRVTRAMPTALETTGIRDFHEISIELTEVGEID